MGGKMKTEKTSVKILLIDGQTKDFPAFLQMMATIEAKRTTDRPLELIYTDTLTSGLKQLAKGGINLVLLGHPLPMGEEEAIAKINETAPLVPIIAVAANKHKKIALDALKNGANGYLLKGKDSTEELGRLIAQI
jgi:DNA-binding NarL/FixJ family response regulator